VISPDVGQGQVFGPGDESGWRQKVLHPTENFLQTLDVLFGRLGCPFEQDGLLKIIYLMFI
jgi:hypothetical protein